MNSKIFSEKIEITPDLVKELKAELRRTGLGPQAILRGTQNNRPKGLNSILVKNWLNGDKTSAEKGHFDYIKSLWASFPDKETAWVVLNQRKRDLLQQKFKATGMSAKRLFAHRKDQPKGFDRKNLSSYYASSRQRIRKDFYRYIIRVCDENEGNGYVPLTPKIQRQLQAEIHRTGLSPAAFIRELKKEEEPEFKHALLNSWLRGEVETLDKRLLNEVLRKYAAFPGKEKDRNKGQPFLITNDLKPINSFDLAKMQQYRDVLGILPGRIFDGVNDAPPGLTRNMVSGWLNGATGNANPNYVEWVLKCCREMVKNAAEIE